MRSRWVLRLAAAVGALAATVAVALGALAVTGPSTPTVAPAVNDPTVPSMSQDMGLGEYVVLVLGGTYASRSEALAADASFDFGDLQGYYAASKYDFRGLEEFLNTQDDYVLVSAFRTQEGAEDFAELARAAGAPAAITPRLMSLGLGFAGLGQEPAPDGSGPLTEPIPASLP